MTDLKDLRDLRPAHNVVTPATLADFRLGDAAKDLLHSALRREGYSFRDYTSSRQVAGGNNYAPVPNQYLLYAHLIHDVAVELYKYISAYSHLRDTTLSGVRQATASAAQILELLRQDPEAASFFGSDEQAELFARFAGSDTPESRFGAKNLFDSNGPRAAKECFASAIQKMVNMPAVASGAFGELVYDLCAADGLYDRLSELLAEDAARQAAAAPAVPSVIPPAGEALTGGGNILYYGAPGTGKSYSVDRDARGHVVRTVFHPDTQNSDFTGSLKPVLKDDTVRYEFSPGPFARALADAVRRPDTAVTLIIEELNRAPAAAVFGELFLLLDRDADGTGCYDADFPSEEFRIWFEAQTGVTGKMRLPANLWILATMNSADQGVYPLDTAFRRRWASRYVPIDYAAAAGGDVMVRTSAGNRSVSWRRLVEHLNAFLVAGAGVEEDRLIGPRFLDSRDLADGKLPGKLLIYLWDDLLRHNQRSVLFDSSIRTYGDLHIRQDNGERIFSPAFLEGLEAAEPDAGTAE